MASSAKECARCTAGRNKVKEAYRKGGVVGVIKHIPDIVRTIGGKEPNIRKQKWPK